MDAPTPLVVWILVVSGVTTGAVIALLGMVFAWNQRRIAIDAKRWGQHLLAAQDEERHRIARELHDDLVPRIHLARLATERLATGEAEAQLGEVAMRIRTLAHDLHPPALEYLDLGQALSDLVNRHRSADGPAIVLEAATAIELQGDMAVTLFRIAQEGLANALKHASARGIRLCLKVMGDGVQLSIEDDGAGMPAAPPPRPSFGLRSMRERLDAVGGTLAIEPVLPTGTRILAKVPSP